MILKIRVDDRLLHGQVAYSWKAALSYDAIVIVSDSAAKDEMRKMALKLCCPDGVKLAVRTVDAGAELLKNPKLKNMKVFVIAPDPETVYRLTKLIDEKPVINIGGMQMHDEKKMFSKAVYVDQTDVDYMDKLEAKGYKLEIQEVPPTPVYEYQSVRKNMEGSKHV